MLSFEILRNRDFRRLLAARFTTTLALQAQAVIVGWQIYSLTKDPWMLGLTGLAEAAPALVSSLFAGHIVDISRPHRVYALALVTLCLNTFVLMLVGGGHLPLAESTIVAVLFAGVFVSGLARAFTMPASTTLIPMLVPRPQLAGANAWMGSLFQSGAIAGPALAGIVYGGYGARGAWIIPFALLTVSVFVAFSLKPAYAAAPRMREPAWVSILSGWRFILKSPVVLSVMALDMFAVLFGGAVAMLPAYADQVLHVGPEGLGLLRAAPFAGSVAVGLFLALRPMRHLSGAQLLWVFAGFGLCMLGFGLSHVMWFSLLCLAVSGAFDGINMVIRGTIVQLLTPVPMMGRVSAIKSMFVISSNEIGAFESGTAARFLGLVPSVVFGAVMSLAVVAIIAILSPSLRKTAIDSHHEH
ncbi:MAG: MFS transporter [Rhodospirillales bacterium]|nr:MFS transporter [Alphaproteobacteria bacterium]MCB9986718.1 MFS transporter [Rhodospirillales bacterium]USO08512.1 MAG: MFS transporter [Rhodospirillales bacterium]